MADITKIQPMGTTTQYTLGARYLTTGRTFQIKDNDATNAGPASSAFNGTANIIMNLPSTIKASLSGNASTATALTSNAGSSTQPIYFTGGKPTSCKVPTSGAWFQALPVIGSDGVMEVGKYIDFHTSNTGTSDHDVRITAATTGLTLSGTTSGTFSGNLTGNVTGNCSGSSGSCTGNAATATKLSNTPNNTTTFLRGDNTWSNAVTGYINSYGLWADSNWNDGNEHQVGVQGNAGKIYMYSQGSTSSNRGLYSCNASGTYTNVLAVLSNNDVYMYPHLIQMSDRGQIYSDNYGTGYAGLVCSGGTSYLTGAVLALHSNDGCDNNGPGNFYLHARPTSGTDTGVKSLVGNTNGRLDWNGGLNITGGANPNVGTTTGHTISTNGNIGCLYEMYAERGFYAGGTSPSYRLWSNHASNWYDALVSYNDGNTSVNACGGRLHVGWQNTGDILIGPSTNGYKLGCWNNYMTAVARATGGNPWAGSAFEIREVQEVSNSQADYVYAPKIGFHWANRVASEIALESDGVMRFRGNADGVGGLMTIQAGAVWGAVWNDYAECRNVPEAQNLMEGKKPIENYETTKRNIPLAGYCVYEVGDDTMALSTKRLQKGCKIISDTFGFNIGETKDAKTPIAVCGRVLAYPYEDREEYRNHIGDFVCSGPKGTISIMTDEEALTQPWSIIGTISAVPDYERWGEDNVLVDGRIWIYVK